MSALAVDDVWIGLAAIVLPAQRDAGGAQAYSVRDRLETACVAVRLMMIINFINKSIVKRSDES